MAIVSRTPEDHCGGKGQKPLGLASEAQAAIAPHKQFINCRPARDLVKAGPDGQFVQANRKDQSLRSSSRRLDPLLRRVSSLSTAGFDRAQWPVYQGQLTGRANLGSSFRRLDPLLRHISSLSTPAPPTDLIKAGPDASLSRPAPTGEANP